MKGSTSVVIFILTFVKIIFVSCDLQSPLVVLENNFFPFVYEYRFPECISKKGEDLRYVCKTDVVNQPKRFCHPDDRQAQEFCLYEVSQTKQTCEGDVEPEIVPATDSNGYHKTCGKDENLKLYKFGYKICKRENSDREADFVHMVIYEFCFHQKLEKVAYVSYRIISPKLLNMETSKLNEIQESDFSSGDFKYQSFNIVEFSEFKRQRDYYDQRKDMEKIMLIPPSHMTLNHWKKPLYHQANVKLMKPRFVPFWNELNEFVKLFAAKYFREMKIKTGVFDSTETEMDADIWWTLIYDVEEKHAIAIILHNTDTEPSPEQHLCQCICHDNSWSGLIHEDFEDFAYCCPPDVITSRIGFASNIQVFNSKTVVEGYRKPFVVLQKTRLLPVPFNFRFPFCANKEVVDGPIDYTPADQPYEVEYFCPPLPSNRNRFPSEFCLVSNSKSSNEGWASDRCSRGIVKPEIDGKRPRMRCGRNNVGLHYKCGYKLCGLLVDSSTLMDIYEFCKDKQSHKIIYVDYKIISPKLLENEVLKDEDKFTSRERYFEIMKGTDPSLKITSLTRTMLIPPSHMALYAWKQAVIDFDYNYDYLFNLRIELLNNINEYIKNVALTKLGEIRIKAGVIKSPKMPTKATIWWKLLYDETAENAIAIIIHNILDTENKDEKLCPKCICSDYGWQDLIPRGSEEFAYCCPPQVILSMMGLPEVGLLNLNEARQVGHFNEAEKCTESK